MRAVAHDEALAMRSQQLHAALVLAEEQTDLAASRQASLEAQACAASSERLQQQQLHEQAICNWETQLKEARRASAATLNEAKAQTATAEVTHLSLRLCLRTTTHYYRHHHHHTTTTLTVALRSRCLVHATQETLALVNDQLAAANQKVRSQADW